MQALVQAQADPNFNDFAEHTKAILFLGTPHRGSSFSTWGWLLAQSLYLLGSNPVILANLEYDSTSLLDLHRAFVRKPRQNLQVFNFFEKRPTPVFRVGFIQWARFVSEVPAFTKRANVRYSVFESSPLLMRHQMSVALGYLWITMA